MKMSTYYLLRIPLPLPEPRHCVTHGVRIDHDAFDPGTSAFSHALRVLVAWAEKEHGKHERLPGEWATRSYLRRPIKFEGTNDDVLEQLAACGARVRVITTEADSNFSYLAHMEEMFTTSNALEVWSVVPPAPESSEEATILDS